MLISIQVARAIAVLAVMLRHLEWVYNDIQGTSKSWDSPLLLIGGHGVDLFFCISGFIIAYLLSERTWDTRDFFLRRFIRIYPMYWLFTVGYIAAVAVGCETGERTDCTQILDVDYLARSLLILPQATFPALSVGWSLEHEVIFYGVAGVICVMAGMSTRTLLLSILLLGGAGIVLDVISPAILGYGVWSTDVFSPYHFEFAAGIAVFMFRREIERLNPLICIALGLVAFWVTHETGMMTPGPGPGASPQTWQSGLSNLASVIGYSVGSAALLSGLLGAEARGVFRRGPRPWLYLVGGLVLIGNASYGLYLMQPLAYGVIGKIMQNMFEPALMLPALLVAALATLAAGTIWYWLVERPFLHFTHRFLTPLRTQPASH